MLIQTVHTCLYDKTCLFIPDFKRFSFFSEVVISRNQHVTQNLNFLNEFFLTQKKPPVSQKNCVIFRPRVYFGTILRIYCVYPLNDQRTVCISTSVRAFDKWGLFYPEKAYKACNIVPKLGLSELVWRNVSDLGGI